MSWYKVDPWEEQVGELRLGKVLLRAWEWCDDGTTPAMWEETLRTLCEIDGIDAYFLRLERKSLTIAWNTAANPTDEFVQEGVARIEYDRLMGRTLPSKEDYVMRTQRPFVLDLSKLMP